MNIKYLIGFTGRSEPDEKTYMYKDMRQVKENKRLHCTCSCLVHHQVDHQLFFHQLSGVSARYEQ